MDNDNKKKVELINSIEKDEVVKTLKLFTKIKTITRDFSQTYKNAINEALPKAIQIVDRFHILKNLTDDLNDYLKKLEFYKLELQNVKRKRNRLKEYSIFYY